MISSVNILEPVLKCIVENKEVYIQPIGSTIKINLNGLPVN